MSTELRERVDKLNQDRIDLIAEGAMAISDLAKKGETTFDPHRFKLRKDRLELDIKNAESVALRFEIPEIKLQLDNAKRDLKLLPPEKVKAALRCQAAKEIFDQAMLEYSKVELREYSLQESIIQLNLDLIEKKGELKALITELVGDLRPDGPTENRLIRN